MHHVLSALCVFVLSLNLFKGFTMYTISNQQLKLIKQALNLLETKIKGEHTLDEFETLVEAFNAYDDVIDNQEVSQ